MTYATEPGPEFVERPRPLSWSAIIAGAIAALVIHFLLNLLGLGIGAANIGYAVGADADVVGGAAFAWWAVAGVIAAACGGIIAGRMAKQGAHMNAASHGLGAWAIATLAVLVALGGGFGAGATTGVNLAGPLGAQLADYGALTEQARAPAASADATATLSAEVEAAGDRIATGALISLAALLIGALAAATAARWAAGRVSVGEPLAAHEPQLRRAPPSYYRDGDETRPH